MNYSAYLRSDAWQERRKAALKRAGNRCTLCAATDNLQVHHNSYKNLGNELPEDLTVLCDSCHERHSKFMPRRFDWLGRISSKIFEGIRW